MSITQNMIDINGPDGTFQGYLATPMNPQGAVIVAQEIFGVNDHIRGICDDFAEVGYTALAPELFWRIEPGFALNYEPEDIARGREVMARVSVDAAVDDVFTSMMLLESMGLGPGRTAVVGYCWGGLIAFLSAARLDPACVSAYYGGGTVNYLDEVSNIQCPMIMHFGSEDAAISQEQVERIREAMTGLPAEVYSYEGAGHGFNCDRRASYHADSASLARERTLSLLQHQIG